MKKIRLGLLTGVFALSVFSVGVSAAEVDSADSVVHVDDAVTSPYTHEGSYTGMQDTYSINQKFLRDQMTTTTVVAEEPVVTEPTIVEAEVIEPVAEPIAEPVVKKGKRR